jgi:mannosyltransferase
MPDETAVDDPARGSFFARHAALIVAGLTLIGALLRIYRLGSKSLWFDEAALWWIGAGSPSEVLAKNISSNAAPPLFAFVIALTRTVGDSEWLLRAVPCLAGIAAIPAVYWLARRFLDRGPACFAALLVAVSPMHVYYSQQVREYTLAATLGAVVLALFAGARWKDDWRTWTLLTLTCCVSIFVHYGLAVLVLGLNVVAGAMALRMDDRRRFLSRWALSQALVTLAVVAVMKLALVPQWQQRPPDEYSHIQDAYWSGSLSSLRDLAFHNTRDLLRLVCRLWAFTALLVAVGLVECVRDRRKRPALALALVPWLLTLALALCRKFPYSGGRQNIYLLPMLCVIGAAGFSLLGRADRHRIVAACIVAFCAGAGVLYTVRMLHAPGKEDMRPIAAKLAEEARPGDSIVVNFSARHAFSYYYRSGPGQVLVGPDLAVPDEDEGEQMQAVLEKPGRVWIVLSHLTKARRTDLLDWVGSVRDVEPAGRARQAWLYVAEPRPAPPPAEGADLTASSAR